MTYPALVTLLLLLQYMVFTGLVGRARVKHQIAAPAVTGHDEFERYYRVQINTLEQLVVTLPALWLCAYFANATLAAALGLAFFTGRILYARSYVLAPESRAPGMIIGFLANVILVVAALWGVTQALL